MTASPSTPEHFDTIVLGGGKGGKSLAMALGPAGHRVALVEIGQIGGTCINVACIPTKTLVASAKVVETAERAAADFGVAARPAGDSLAGVMERKRRVVAGMVDAHWQLFTGTPGMELVLGTARFAGPRTLDVVAVDGTRRTLTADRIVINTGSLIDVPPIVGLSDVDFLTSTSVMELTELPEHLIVIGAGYIAVEFAQIFRRLGSRVTVLDRGARFLPREDADIADAIAAFLGDDGVTLLAETAVEGVGAGAAGGVDVRISDPGGPAVISGSHLLVATGRVPNTAELDLTAAGIEVGPRGGIVVDESLRTTAADVYAIGDCNGGPMFTHASWDDFRILRDNLLHDAGRTTTDRLVPYTLFTDPELGRVGLSEDQARAAGHDIAVGVLPAGKIPRAVTSGETRGLLKLVVDRGTDQILGCSLLCHNAGEVASVVQVAMTAGMRWQDLGNVMFSHPTMAESLNLLTAEVARVTA